MNMKTLSSQIRLAALGAALLFSAGTLSAQDGVRYEAQPGSKIKIDGTSTIHEWTVESAIIGGFVELDSGFDFNSPKAGKVNAKVEATIPSRSLHNKNGYKGMDERMHDALKVNDYKKITYKLTELKLKEAPKAAGEPLHFDSKGELTVSGVTQTLSMPVTMEKQDGKLKTSGDLSLKMTSFKIDPPAPKIALGLISTGDDIKIHFEWLTSMPQKSADAK
jgi:polyisoprenoid-binding protein YceI